MNLHEYQAKQLFARYGLPAPVGYACTTPREAEEAASKIGAGPWVVKCQVHAGGRGKAGGVKVVNSKEDIRAFAENWLGKRLVTYQTDANGNRLTRFWLKQRPISLKSCISVPLLTVVPVAWSLWPPPKAAWKLKKWRKKLRT